MLLLLLSRGFDNLLELDDKGDVSTRDNGSGLGRFSQLIQISAERLAELMAYVSTNTHCTRKGSNGWKMSPMSPNNSQRSPTARNSIGTIIDTSKHQEKTNASTINIHMVKNYLRA
ncbi:hypothetical protein GQ457_04G022810 [Hibiscus cannabinus]